MTESKEPAEIKHRVQSQFGRSAQDYASSDVHARGESLDWLVENLAPQPTWSELDVATGAGHTALRLAPHVAHVIASDLTAEMLDQTQQLAAEAGITNIQTQLADAESLPFEDNSFDLVTCRLALHHFPNAAKAATEFARVLKPDGLLGFTDNFTTDDRPSAEFYNQFERIRDPSHVIVRCVRDLRELFVAAGFEIVDEVQLSKTFEFHAWADRMRVNESDKQRLLEMMNQIPSELKPMLSPQWNETTFQFDLWEIAWIARLAVKKPE